MKSKKLQILMWTAALLISFIMGSLVAEFQISPVYDFFGRAFSAASAVTTQTVEYNHANKTDLWVKTRQAQSGVTTWNKKKACNGYTFFTSGHAQKAFLIDMKGRIVHEWQADLSDIWPAQSHLRKVVDDPVIAWRRALLMPNGDIYVVIIGEGVTPWGYGLAKLDQHSNRIWTINDHFHHDVTLGEDGNLYALVHHISKTPIPDLPEVTQPYLRDSIVVLSPEGKELKRIDLLNAVVKRFKQTGELNKLYVFVYRRNGDFLHTNTAKYIPASFADRIPEVDEGDILVSFRSMNMLAAIDPDSEEVVWTLQGPWVRQHDPDMLSNGNLLVFDNRGREFLGYDGSSIVEFDPVRQKVKWLYTGQEVGFTSDRRGSQQTLANGNILITEAQGGRMLEITPEKERVWEWISPYRSSPDGKFTAVVMGGHRFTKEELPFLNDN